MFCIVIESRLAVTFVIQSPLIRKIDVHLALQYYVAALLYPQFISIRRRCPKGFHVMKLSFVAVTVLSNRHVFIVRTQRV